jgi:peptidoglycan/LPS O-acetylase OafA/YrhL
MKYLTPGIFRLWLAVLVLLSHSCRIDLGLFAVYVFFVLSGYWIFAMWQAKYTRLDKPTLQFWASRIWRLLPMFWLVNLLALPIFIGIDPAFAPPANWASWAHAVFSNVAILGYASLPRSAAPLRPAWSLDIELQFYLIAPFLFLLLRKRWAYWIFIAGSIGGLVLFLRSGLDATPRLYCFAAFFLVGILCAKFKWQPGNKVARVLAVLIGLTVAFVASQPNLRFLVENAHHGATILNLEYKRAWDVGLALAVSPLAIFSAAQVSSRPDREIGEATYTLYLMHWPIMMAQICLFAMLPPLQRAPSIAAAWLTIAVLAYIAYKFFDKPINEARKRALAEMLARVQAKQRIVTAGEVPSGL